MLHSQSINLLVTLGTRGVHRSSFGGIQQAKLDSGHIRIQRHFSSESIDFTYNLALSNSADRRIATHGSNRINIPAKNESTSTHSCGREGGFATSMTRSANNDIVAVSRIFHGGR